MRKRLSTDVESTAAVIDLGPDDELVSTVTTTKTVGRKRKPPEVSASDVTVEDGPDYASETVIDGEVIDVDDEGDAVPAFSENSFAALLYGDAEDDYSSEYFTLIIRREPDDVRDSFLTPCSDQTYIGKMRNISLTADRDDIADKIRHAHGGGRYTLQMHYGGKLCKTYPATIADDPARLRESRREAVPATVAASQPPPVAVDPMDAVLNNLEKLDRMKKIFGVDRESEMAKQIAELKAEIDRGRLEPAEPKSERLTLLETALKAGTESGVSTRILDNLFPSEEAEKRHWAADLLQVAIENKDTLMPLAGSLFGSFFGGQMPPPQPQPPMQYQPPPTMPPQFDPTPKKSLFAPKQPLSEVPEPEAIKATEPTPETVNETETEAANG